MASPCNLQELDSGGFRCVICLTNFPTNRALGCPMETDEMRAEIERQEGRAPAVSPSPAVVPIPTRAPAAGSRPSGTASGEVHYLRQHSGSSIDGTGGILDNERLDYAEPDPDIINLLERHLQMARTGQIRAIAFTCTTILAGEPVHGITTGWSRSSNGSTWDLIAGASHLIHRMNENVSEQYEDSAPGPSAG